MKRKKALQNRQSHKVTALQYRGKQVKSRVDKQKKARIRAIDLFSNIPESEIRAVYDKCHNACVYCGARQRLTLDHFIPLAKGGHHATYNLVIACSRCNSSKRASDALTWYKQQSFYDRGRWDTILNLLNM